MLFQKPNYIIYENTINVSRCASEGHVTHSVSVVHTSGVSGHNCGDPCDEIRQHRPETVLLEEEVTVSLSGQKHEWQ